MLSGRNRWQIGCVVFLLLWATSGLAQKGSYLFIWAGDDTKEGSDFLAVIDADPESPKYGQALASVAVPGKSGTPHHTELEMPAGGFLLANAFGSGRSMLFDLRAPLKPTLVTSFGDLDGYMHPHTYVRFPNGHVLITFQYRRAHGPNAEGGGLVEVTPGGELVRSSSAMDPAAPAELIRPYSPLVIPALDRVVTTNTAMHEADGNARTVQLWRLSDLKLLRTLTLPPGPGGSEHQNPGEMKLLDDGKTVLVHTFSCGLYQLDGIETDQPRVRHRYTFEGSECAVPLRIGRFWLQTLSTAHAVASYDLSDPTKLGEVSRLTFDDKQKPHWISADQDAKRIVMNSGENGDHRLFILNFDKKTGRLEIDRRFRDPGSDRPGVSMDGKTWPHGFRGDAYPHGAVFSRADTAAGVSAPLQDLVAVAPQAATVEYEDDRIRIVRLRLPPGGSLPMHDRPARVVIPLTTNDARLSRADGTTSVARTDPYRVTWSEPTRRSVTNLAATPLENIVVELKIASAPAKAAQAPAGPPTEYLEEPRHRWLFENQYVRVYDVRIPRGDTTEFHRHAYDTVYVRPSGGRVATQVQGEPWGATTEIASGSVVFDADSKRPFTHRVRNDGTAEYHAIAIQLLPR
jgi:quercetin dioxygenase-like cupin family protein